MPDLSEKNNGDWPESIDNLDKNKKLSNMYEDQFEMMFGKSIEFIFKEEYNNLNLQKEKKDNGQDK